jgi:hypothetical protein
MRTRLILAFFLAGAVSVATAQVPGTSTEKDASGKLVIRKAVYGNLPDGATRDVTDKVRAMVKNGALSVAATDDNFGDPFNGNMKLTITSAEIRAPGVNLGGAGGAGDITQTVKQFQNGNTLNATFNGNGPTVTVYYDYGDGKRLSTQSGNDGSLNITTPTQLRVDYTFNGVDMSKTVGYKRTCEINDTTETPANYLKPFLGAWSGNWADMTVRDMTIEEQGGKAKVTRPGYDISAEQLEGGSLSYKVTVISSGKEFLYTVTPTSSGLDLKVVSIRDRETYFGKLIKQ